MVLETGQEEFLVGAQKGDEAQRVKENLACGLNEF